MSFTFPTTEMYYNDELYRLCNSPEEYASLIAKGWSDVCTPGVTYKPVSSVIPALRAKTPSPIAQPVSQRVHSEFPKLLSDRKSNRPDRLVNNSAEEQAARSDGFTTVLPAPPEGSPILADHVPLPTLAERADRAPANVAPVIAERSTKPTNR